MILKRLPAICLAFVLALASVAPAWGWCCAAPEAAAATPPCHEEADTAGATEESSGCSICKFCCALPALASGQPAPGVHLTPSYDAPAAEAFREFIAASSKPPPRTV